MSAKQVQTKYRNKSVNWKQLETRNGSIFSYTCG